jgi:CHASE2 domain-containing sensor protein
MAHSPDPLAVELDRLYVVTGFKRLTPVWAKLELLFGLAAAGAGLLLEVRAARAEEIHIGLGACGLALFVLGFYLALAGHRSHLYQSQNRLAAYLAGLIRSTTPEARP